MGDVSVVSLDNCAKERNSKMYRYCFVPGCKNTSIKTPNKLFITVPREKKRRKQWMRAARRQDEGTALTPFFCCGDHFNLRDDVENYMQVALVGGNIRLKKNLVPHIFTCQPSRSSENISPDPSSRNVAIKTYSWKSGRKEMRNKRGINTKKIDPGNSSIRRKKHKQARSPVKNGKTTEHEMSEVQSDILTDSEKELCKMSELSEEQDEFVPLSGVDNEQEKSVQESIERMMKLCQTQSMLYLGIPTSQWFILQRMADLVKTQETTLNSEQVVCLVLMKCRLNLQFKYIANNFGISESCVSRLFNFYAPMFAHLLERLIIWPDESTIKKNLPASFQDEYKHVEAIIDCVEIKVQKPSHPVKQALTWSEYKKCNTMKYLISIAPHGLITFISRGYGGCCSDSLLISRCGFLQKLPPGSAVMADREFKNLDLVLLKRNCRLIGLPSASEDGQLDAKNIASVREHVERIIRRIREFKFLQPHASTDAGTCYQVDNVIKIAGMLVNLQGAFVE
ncbi:Uncharacterised protein g4211 [Pycnogonum litorale]